mgnify:FL=1|tara:strand:- start:26278 stop:27033 length:756 start_codon:yes stop_codon:yes gene_type:complete
MRIILCICLISFYASAQSAFNSDRPGQSYSPISLEARQILVQQGFEFGATLLDSITTQRSTNYFTEVRVGLGGNFEAGLGYGNQWINNTITDNEFNLQPSQNPWLMLRYSLDLNLPKWHLGFLVRSQINNVEYRGILSYDFIEDLSFTINYGIFQDGDRVDGFYTINASYAYHRFSYFIEAYGANYYTIGGRDFRAYNMGGSYSLGPNFQMEVFAGWQQSAFNQNVTQPFINAGFSWLIDFQKEEEEEENL